MIITLLIFFGLYFICMLTLIVGFKRISLFKMEITSPKTNFSIVIPFRNEAKNLPFLLKSISNLNYPSEHFEVLLVDDDSEDASEGIIKQAIEESPISIYLLQNLRLSNSPKKDAITEAIKHSQFNWIITTDADCELPQNWLKTFDAFIQEETEKGSESILICGPVIYTSNKCFIQDFQQLDGFSLQAVTMGSFGLKNPILCNGANLAYQKSAFIAVNGYAGNDQIASGDDIFLLEKIKKMQTSGVKFLKAKDAIVSTSPQLNWQFLINQRVRWASKTGKQKNPISLFLGIFVFMINFFLLLLPLAIIFDFQNAFFYISLILLKMLSDLMLIRGASNFFGRNISIYKFPGHAFTYALMVIIVAFKSLNGEYLWKGRRFRNQK